MDVEFKKDYAYGTTTQSDGITHIVDEGKRKSILHLSITETYSFNESDPNADAQLLDCILRDLDRLKGELERLKDNRIDKKIPKNWNFNYIYKKSGNN